MKRSFFVPLLVIAVVFLSVGCQGTSADPMSKPYISVNGSGSLKAAPDTAKLSITVATEKKDEQAQTINAEKVDKLVNFLKEAGLEENEIKTVGANFYPNTKWEDGKEVDLGYRAENMLQIETKKMDLIGKIIDGSVANGAERVSGLSFTLSDEGKENLLEDIIGVAVNDARTQAESAVSSLGQSIDGVKSVIVTKENSSPIYRAMDNYGTGGAKEMSQTPVLPGELDYSINVSVEFFIK